MYRQCGQNAIGIPRQISSHLDDTHCGSLAFFFLLRMYATLLALNESIHLIGAPSPSVQHSASSYHMQPDAGSLFLLASPAMSFVLQYVSLHDGLRDELLRIAVQLCTVRLCTGNACPA